MTKRIFLAGVFMNMGIKPPRTYSFLFEVTIVLDDNITQLNLKSSIELLYY